MSYLDLPRIHFSGRFQADTSTVNNDVRHYDSAAFSTTFQDPMRVKDQKIVRYNGYWNPEGSGAWRMLGCKVTGAVLDDCFFTSPEQDPVVGLALGDAVDRVAAKLVDLDPQQQMVSQIWGLQIRLQNERGKLALGGEFSVSPFCDLWLRQQNLDEWLDQQLAAAYQSILEGVTWDDYEFSPTLRALKAASEEGLLSIRMNVFGFDRTPTADDFATGVVVGTIGPARACEPMHFAMGRHLTPRLEKKPSYPFVPADKVANIQALVSSDQQWVSVDLGNALPITDSVGTLEDIGNLAFGVLKDGDTQQGAVVAADKVEILGKVDYLESPQWYFQTAGLVDFAVSNEAKPLINDHPLALLCQQAAEWKVLNRETQDGLFVRADNFVYRLNPGEMAEIHFRASCYGKPSAQALKLADTEGFMGGAGTGAILPNIPIPDVNTPAGVVSFPNGIETDCHGRAVAIIQASEKGPGNPRGYLDGQLYGLAYNFANPPKGLQTNPFNYISILIWDRYEQPEYPTWNQDIAPILTQYGNLYPIMSKRLVDLSNYDSVVANLPIMKLSFSLPRENPNHMPVTRDLSDCKRETILKWLNSKDPVTGLPPKGPNLMAQAGTPAACGGAPAAEFESEDANLSSKVTFLRQAVNYQQQ